MTQVNPIYISDLQNCEIYRDLNWSLVCEIGINCDGSSSIKFIARDLHTLRVHRFNDSQAMFSFINGFRP